MKNNKIISGILIIAFYFVLQMITAVVGSALAVINGVPLFKGEVSNPAADYYLIVGYGLVALIAVLCLGYKYRQQIKVSFNLITANKLNFLKKLVIYIIIYFGIIYLFGKIDSLLFAQYATEAGTNEDTLNQALIANPSFLVATGIAIWIPIIEEYVYRYGIISRILGGINKYLAASIATIIFTLVHIGIGELLTNQPTYVIHLLLAYLPTSLLLNFMYVKEENLTYPLIIHIINNSISVMVTLLFMG